ncbi:MAG: leucine-rich repeat protein [Paludibacteraceae bacterium]|nr:leucine-rich repeat protein [Paludibacteraceae bacterium]
MQSLSTPDGVVEIGDATFYDCTNLEEFALPASIRAIGDNCFTLCCKLSYIVVEPTTPPEIQA